jgi:hypothetical protein
MLLSGQEEPYRNKPLNQVFECLFRIKRDMSELSSSASASVSNWSRILQISRLAAEKAALL